jgi:hypothetical protein
VELATRVEAGGGGASVAAPARKKAGERAEFIAAGEGLHVVTAGVEFAGRCLREWTGALVRVE